MLAPISEFGTTMQLYRCKGPPSLSSGQPLGLDKYLAVVEGPSPGSDGGVIVSLCVFA
jgi:hypothetical protein